MKRLAFASHVALIQGKEYDGVGNVLIEELSSITSEFTVIRHSMEGNLASELRLYKDGNITQTVMMGVRAHPAPLRYVSEVVRTVRLLSKSKNIEVYIGVNPLNAFAGIVLKKLKKINTVIYYTSDYSPRRFNNTILDQIYHRIDEYCVKNANEVWSVSSRIVAMRKDKGLADNKNIFLPNVPPLKYDMLRSKIFNKYQLITTGVIDVQLDYEGIIRAVAQLADEYPEISLLIIGNGPEEGRLRKLVEELGVQDRVEFTGRLPLPETLKRVSMAGIGLALYTGVWGFNYYGDSTKCREYFAYGLPVLSTDTHSTVGDIKQYKSGIVANLDVNNYVAAIRDIFSNYELYSQNSLKLGEKYKGIHRRELLRILQG